jgi:PAS domain S-box-containing protein
MEIMKPNRTADDVRPETKNIPSDIARLLSLVHDGLMMIDRQGRITYVNRAMGEIAGCTVGEMLGGTLDEPRWNFKCAVSPSGQICAILQSVLQTKKQMTDEVCHLDLPEGRRGPFMVNATPYYDESGDLAGIVAIINDRTEFSKVRAEKEQIRAVYERLAQYSDEAIFRIEMPGGVISFINEAAQNIFGYSPDEYRSDAGIRQRVISSGQLQMWADEFGHPSNEKNVLRNVVVKGKAKNGQTVVMEYTVIGIRGDDGLLTCFECMGRDITLRRLMEAELARAQKLESIGLLAGGIAHDFNNILMAVFGSLSLAKLKSTPKDPVYTFVAKAEEQCLRARALTRKLLAYSSGGTLQRKTVLIADAIRDTADFALSGKNVKCRFSLPDGLWPAHIDEGQMRQVVHALVTNACEAMPGGGIVEIGAENIELADGQIQALKAGRYIRWYVRDHGAGMSAECLRRVFDPYFTTKPMNSIKGIGLGLAICHSIVKSHDGLIAVESMPGEGSVFTIFLPAVSEGHEEQKTAPSLTARAEGRQKILLIDDEQILLDVTGSMLEHLGYDVKKTKSHGEGRELYRQAEQERDPFALIIMDLTMRGDEPGETAIRRWKQEYPEVRAIISSGYTKDPVIEEYWKYGFVGAMAKPYSLEDLKGTLEKILA